MPIRVRGALCAAAGAAKSADGVKTESVVRRASLKWGAAMQRADACVVKVVQGGGESVCRVVRSSENEAALPGVEVVERVAQGHGVQDGNLGGSSVCAGQLADCAMDAASALADVRVLLEKTVNEGWDVPKALDDGIGEAVLSSRVEEAMFTVPWGRRGERQEGLLRVWGTVDPRSCGG